WNIAGNTVGSAIVANAGCSGFRATVTEQVLPNPDANSLSVPEQLANELNLGGYSQACYLPLSQSREESQGRQQPCQKPVTEEIRYAH
ncbi:MAG TPA: arginine N-succinyltransferase, partial [Marinobacter adhaerens]|nr:arginine N-succinyltransferase [Marinobacter adhaerens]